jgi:hypothetical protein
MMVSTVLTRARRSGAALALDPLPAPKVQSDPLQFAEVDKHDCYGIDSWWIKQTHARRTARRLMEP